MQALAIGLSYTEAMNMPLGELLDLLAAHAVRSGRCRIIAAPAGGADEFWALMERK